MKQKIKQKTLETAEHIKQNTAEAIRQNFTEIKAELLSQLSGKEPTPEQKGNKNFTPFNEEVRKKMGEHYDKQDQSELEEVRKKLAKEADPQEAIRRQFEFMKKEEREAIEALQREEMERKRKEEEEQQMLLQQQQQAHAQIGNEPSTKQKRGMLFGGKKKRQTQTVETKIGKGKQ